MPLVCTGLWGRVRGVVVVRSRGRTIARPHDIILTVVPPLHRTDQCVLFISCDVLIRESLQQCFGIPSQRHSQPTTQRSGGRPPRPSAFTTPSRSPPLSTPFVCDAAGVDLRGAAGAAGYGYQHWCPRPVSPSHGRQKSVSSAHTRVAPCRPHQVSADLF
jgi:hypothetical protein